MGWDRAIFFSGVSEEAVLMYVFIGVFLHPFMSLIVFFTITCVQLLTLRWSTHLFVY